MVVVEVRCWKALKKGGGVLLAVCDTRKGYRKGVNVPGNEEHLGGIFCGSLEIG